MGKFSIPAHFTAQQRAFLEAVLGTPDHLFLKATAGAGKTTTLAAAAHALKQKGVYFAYNKHAVADLAPRLPRRIKARTLHAYGLGILHQVSPKVIDLNDDKARQVAQIALGHRAISPLYTAVRAWNMAREERLLALNLNQAIRIADAAQWEAAPKDLMPLIVRMHAAGQRLYEQQGLVDFTDLLWLPVTFNYAHSSLPLALVDEAQDLTPLRQAFLLHLLGLPHGKNAGRIVFVGDASQAIYKYAGADPQALSRLKATVNATELPLSVSFRCPQQVVQYAQVHSDFIQSAPGAKPGTIEHVAADGLAFERGQVVLCRTNAPLIRLALELMSKQVSINVAGRDLEARLGEGLDEALPANGVYANAQVTELIRAYYDPKAQPLKDRIKDGDLGARRALTELQDLCRCLRFLAWVVSREQAQATLADARRQLSLLCRENLDADVTLSSIHRAKGKEWPHVTILYPELMPLAQGDEEEERAVQFVAITRSQDTLRFAYGKESWAQRWRVKPAGERQEPAPSLPSSTGQEDFLDEDLPDAAPPLDPAHDLVHWDSLPSLPAPRERTKKSLLPLPERTTLRPPTSKAIPPESAVQTPPPAPVKPILTPIAAADTLAIPALVRTESERPSPPPQVITVAPPPPPAIVVTAPPPPVQGQPQAKVKPTKPKADARPTVQVQPQVPPPTSVMPPTPATNPPAERPPGPADALTSEAPTDARPFPLLGGPDLYASPNLKQRLLNLTEEDRPAIRDWANDGLALLNQTPIGLIPIHALHLERFERAARVARVAVPNFEPSKPNTAQVCVFDGPIARIRTGKRKGTGKVLRLVVGSQELKFDPQTGELSGATDPLSPFVLPEALARLQAAGGFK
ncbi:UvrD-helicase domain-containing protein [Deinococcus rubellus]|uniref:UvrD-helicase domain-containing protein n=1 Tax=Deinococcus rubellus TaxID=1889240 RepID=UPI0031E99C58